MAIQIDPQEKEKIKRQKIEFYKTRYFEELIEKVYHGVTGEVEKAAEKNLKIDRIKTNFDTLKKSLPDKVNDKVEAIDQAIKDKLKKPHLDRLKKKYCDVEIDKELYTELGEVQALQDTERQLTQIEQLYNALEVL